jgi:hypothetical protein
LTRARAIVLHGLLWGFLVAVTVLVQIQEAGGPAEFWRLLTTADYLTNSAVNDISKSIDGDTVNGVTND